MNPMELPGLFLKSGLIFIDVTIRNKHNLTKLIIVQTVVLFTSLLSTLSNHSQRSLEKVSELLNLVTCTVDFPIATTISNKCFLYVTADKTGPVMRRNFGPFLHTKLLQYMKLQLYAHAH